MLDRVLEPEVMDTAEEAESYDTMDHRAVNDSFAADALALAPTAIRALDVGTGTALIPLVMVTRSHRLMVTATDLSMHMLRLAARNVANAALTERIGLVQVDAKQLPYGPGDFDLVVSNSVVHHVPDPRTMLREIARVAGPHAAVFVRDLARPADAETLQSLVDRYAKGESDHARALFAASLHAAVTVEELRVMAAEAGLDGVTVTMTSDRHWTLTRPMR